MLPASVSSSLLAAVSAEFAAISTDLQGDRLWPLINRATDAVVIVDSTSRLIVAANETAGSALRRDSSCLAGEAAELIFGANGLNRLLGVSAPAIGGSRSVSVRLKDVGSRSYRAEAVALDFPARKLVAILLHSAGLRIRSRGPTVDALTGLVDRRRFLRHLDQTLRNHRCPSDRRIGLLFIDLDEFKRVNDTHGHWAGDRVLRRVAKRIEGCIRPRDWVTRYGGDEFCALVERLPEEPAATLVRIAQRLAARIAKPIVVGNQELRIGASIGIALQDATNRDGEALLRAADAAMYAAKRQGGGRFALAGASQEE